MNFKAVTKILLLSAVAISCPFGNLSGQTIASVGLHPIGAGSYPLSFSDASAWFAHKATDNEKLVTVLFYFQGKPGWPNQQTDFKWQVNTTPATIDMTVGSVAIHAKYWEQTDEVELQGHRFKRSLDNVFLISSIDSAPTVKPLGVHDLTFGGDDIPSISLLRRDPNVWSALAGRPADEHPLARSSQASPEVVGWDRDGLKLLLSGATENEKKGCELFRRAADRGYAPSQYRLGYCFESGKGVEQSYTTANQWYEKAGSQGYVDAQYKLGHSYRTGRGTAIDLPIALSWYKKAAESGDGDALQNVAWMYATGQGSAADPAEAYRWFLKAAEHDEPGAQFEIARRLKDGDGIVKNLPLSYSWLLVLKAQQNSFSPDDWKQIESMIGAVGSQLSPAAIEKAQDQATIWMGLISTSEIESYSRQ